MHFLQYPNSLWFWKAASGEEVQQVVSATYYVTVSVSPSVAFSASTSAIDKLVSATYNVSVSTYDVTSVQIELSSFAYNVTTSAQNSLLAYLSADSLDGGYERLNALVTIVPVYTLSQTGQVSQTVSATYNVTASAQTASLAAYLTVSASYNVSASGSASLLSSDQFTVSATYNVTTSLAFTLSKTDAAVSKQILASYNITASTTPILVIDRGGGLVWSRKKRKRVPVKVGYPLRDE